MQQTQKEKEMTKYKIPNTWEKAKEGMSIGEVWCGDKTLYKVLDGAFLYYDGKEEDYGILEADQTAVNLMMIIPFDNVLLVGMSDLRKEHNKRYEEKRKEHEKARARKEYEKLKKQFEE